MKISEQIRRLVKRRANDNCEYCRLPQRASILPHQIDHIIAIQHGGADEAGNLCLCCIRCNLKKGPNIAALDPRGPKRPVPLFNPRLQLWQDHFELIDDGQILGRTAEGRATVELLDFNADERVRLRKILIRLGLMP